MPHSVVLGSFVRNLVEHRFELLFLDLGTINERILPVIDAQRSKGLPSWILMHVVDICKILHPCNTDSFGGVVLQ